MYRKITADMPNYRAALTISLQRGDSAEGLRLCSAMRNPWVTHGDATEGADWFDRFLGQVDSVPATVRGPALVFRGDLAFEQQDYATVSRCAAEGLELCREAGDPHEAGALRLLAVARLRAGQLTEATTGIDEAAATARKVGNDWEEGLALSIKAAIVMRLGGLREAQRSYEAALEVLRDNNGWGVAQVRTGLGGVARARGDHEAAISHYRDALALYQEIDARPEIARCLAGIASVALAQGDAGLARTSLTESLTLSRATGPAAAGGPWPGGVRHPGRPASATRPGRPGWRAPRSSCAPPRATRRQPGPGPGWKTCSSRPAGPWAARPQLRCWPRAGPWPPTRRSGTRSMRRLRAGCRRPLPPATPGWPRARPGWPGHAHPARAGDRRADRPRPEQPGDRPGAVHHQGDRGPARRQHHAQAGVQLPGPDRRLDRPAARPGNLIHFTPYIPNPRGPGSEIHIALHSSAHVLLAACTYSQSGAQFRWARTSRGPVRACRNRRTQSQGSSGRQEGGGRRSLGRKAPMTVTDMPAPHATVTQRLISLAAARGGHAALAGGGAGYPGRTLSHARLAAVVQAAAAGLIRRGLRARDLVGVYVPDAVSYTLAVHAVRAAGGVPSPIPTGSPVPVIADQLTDCGARLLITGAPLVRDALAAADGSWVRQVISFDDAAGTVPFASLLSRGLCQPASAEPADLALVPYSQESDGTLIPVPLAHGQLTAQLHELLAEAPITGSDVVLAGPPGDPGQDYTLLLDLALLQGATVVATCPDRLPDVAREHSGTAAIVLPGLSIPPGCRCARSLPPAESARPGQAARRSLLVPTMTSNAATSNTAAMVKAAEIPCTSK